MNAASTSTSPARVLLVDDHAIVRHGIGVLLEKQSDLTICGEAGSYKEALESIQRLQPDVAVIDLILRDRSGLDLIRALRQQGVQCPLLVMSMHDEATHAEKSLRAGAQGYVMKEDADEFLVAALRKVLGGEVFVSGQVSSRMLRSYMDEDDAGVDGADRLTHREKESCIHSRQPCFLFFSLFAIFRNLPVDAAALLFYISPPNEIKRGSVVMRIEVYDPAMCCPSGVCGPDVDPDLTRFAAELDALKRQGVSVARYNLAQEPMAFVQNAFVRETLQEDDGCLPLVLLNGQVLSRGAYPEAGMLAVAIAEQGADDDDGDSVVQSATKEPVDDN